MAYEVEGYSEVVDGVVVQVEPGVELGNLASNPQVRQLASAFNTWVSNVRSSRPAGSLLDRQLYVPPANVYAEMRAAREALRSDDVVSGVHEITESFAFQGNKAEIDDDDTADIFNQINADLDMDSVLRRMWRETYALSQFVMATDWHTKDYKPSPHPEGQRARRTTKYGKLVVPRKIAILDHSCILPVQRGPMADEALLWSATDAEMAAYEDAEKNSDLEGVGMRDFYLGKYNPSPSEVAHFHELGFTGMDKLLILNPKYVQRHTTTKSDYETFADVRLKSIFGLLDMKRQLMDQDRVNLVGAANFILLIRKGDEKQPATPEEMANLNENYRVMAKLPVIISDHRLSIEIIAPKIDLVLTSEKYDLLDSRILSRLLGTLSIGGKGQRNETNVTMSHAVARGMENRRHMLKRFVEKNVYKEIVDRNGSTFPKAPSLAFTPARIALGFDSALSQMLMGLYDKRDLSRETVLEFVGLDQAVEAMRKLNEKANYDGKVFDNVLQPGQEDPNGGDAGSDAANGRNGGRPAGGGNGPASKKVGDKTEGGNPSTKKESGA